MFDRVDSMRLTSAGMFPGPWTQARRRNSSFMVVFRAADLNRLLMVEEETLRAGLYMAMTVGVVMKVVNNAMRTNIANTSSLSTW